MRVALPPLTAVLVVAVLGFDARPRPDLFRIELTSPNPASSLHGLVMLTRPRSPFGLAVTRDGHFIYRALVSATALPDPSSFAPGSDRFVVWATTPNLDQVVRLGTLGAGESVEGLVTYNKFMVLVTAERGDPGTRWQGPIVLLGRSASSYLASFSSHTMFNGGMPQ